MHVRIFFAPLVEMLRISNFENQVITYQYQSMWTSEISLYSGNYQTISVSIIFQYKNSHRRFSVKKVFLEIR